MNLPPLAPERAREIVATLAGTRILVIGDVMLDKFTVGRVSRISPEAPVPVLTFSHETTRLGGAANVANNIVALGGEAILLSVISNILNLTSIISVYLNAAVQGGVIIVVAFMQRRRR